MDDLAVVTDPSTLPGILEEIVELASLLGIRFNPQKSGVANYAPTLRIADKDIRVVNEMQPLGTEAIPSNLGGLETHFAKIYKSAELIEMSALTPMQKLHALRTYVLPMLMHLLENSHSTQKQLQKITET